MGAKLDLVHSDLVRISSALVGSSRLVQESSQDKRLAKLRKKAAARGEKERAKAAKREAAGEGGPRKKQKQQKQAEKRDLGQEPSKAPINKPYLPPEERAGSPQQRTPRPLPLAPVRILTPLPEPVAAPSRAVPISPPSVAKEPETVGKPRPVLGPKVVTEPTDAGPKKSETFLQRVKRAVTGRRRETGIPEPAEKSGKPSRAFGVLKRVAGLLKRKLLREHRGVRTLHAIALVEELSSTSFKKCGAMVSTPYMRHSLPKNIFANPDEENPTFPIRAGCRASKAGVLRALQKDMSNANETLVDRVMRRMNSGKAGGTRGADTLRAWGTGVGGKRMETYRGKPHTPKRTKSLAKRLGISLKAASKLYGISTGRPDMVKHTTPYSPVGGSKGPAGNREVPRHPLAHAKPGHKKSEGKKKREAASLAARSAKGKALVGR